MSSVINHPYNLEEITRLEEQLNLLPNPYRLQRGVVNGIADYPLHHHLYYEIFYMLSGRLDYVIEGRKYILEPGCLLIIPPYHLHQPCAHDRQPYERFLFCFDPSLPETLSSPDCDLNTCLRRTSDKHHEFLCLSSEDRSLLTSLLSALQTEKQSDSFGSALAQNTLLTQIFILLNRAAQQGSLPPAVAPSDTWVLQVVDYLDAHYAEPVTMQTLECVFYRSRWQISREFSRLVGYTPHQYLQQKRLLQAQKLLDEGLPPQQTAIQCGFQDYTNFYRSFHAAYGTGPREYQTMIHDAKTALRHS